MTWNTIRCFSFTCKTRAQLLASKNLGTIYQDTIAEATTFCQIDQRTKELCKITNISTKQEVFLKKNNRCGHYTLEGLSGEEDHDYLKLPS
jgi:hypothetical protein